MGESKQWGVAGVPSVASVPPSETIEPAAFYSLYLGGLSFPDRQQRLRASAVVMLGGRLGLRPGELQHLHEEWIDWGRGELVIPERDPCACRQCWETARHAQRAGDGRTLIDIVTETTWSPPGKGRTVPFGWSQRLTAILAAVCDEEGYLDLTAEAMARLVDRSARRAEGVDHEAIDFSSLRATSISFFADSGFPAHRIARLVGEDTEVVRAFTQQEGGDAREQLFELFDGAITDPGDVYSLLADPEPFDREPFDPRTYDANWRQTRMRQRANDPESLHNPRPVADAANSALDGADLGMRSYLDVDSDLVDETNAATRLSQWVTRQDAARRGREQTAASASQQSPATESTNSSGEQTDGATSSGQSSQSSVDNSASTNDSASGDPTQGGDSQTAGRDSVTTDQDDGTTRESAASVGDTEVFNARDQLSGPPELTVETTVACSDFADGQPTGTRVFLGPEELLLVRNDDSMAPEYRRIELSAVVDQSEDYVPSQLEDVFESTVTIAYNEGDSQRLAVIELTGNKQISFANAVFKQILSESQVVVTHPAQQGGRVLSTDPRAGTLTVNDRSVSISVDEGGGCTIQLSDIIYFELEKQTFESQRFRSLSVRHFGADDEATKTTIAIRDDRKHKLFQRFVRRSYQQRKQQIEKLTLSEDHKEVLVALYSAGDQFDISMIISKPSDELQQLLNSLRQIDLVRTGDNGAVLTGLGRVVVNEKIEDVNM